jgi:hypothetical protein
MPKLFILKMLEVEEADAEKAIGILEKLLKGEK